SRHRIKPAPATSGNIGVKVGLGELELVQETVLENIDFVDVVLAPQPGGMIGDVTNLQDRIVSELPLDAGGPGLHSRGPQVGIKRVNSRIPEESPDRERSGWTGRKGAERCQLPTDQSVKGHATSVERTPGR